MTEEKVKKRGWVKNAAIIFLSVMLLLTFFSNTIMNRSLPEVAAQYAQSGAINARIRGTGTVEANEVYEVVLEQSREVESVAVRVGDAVNAGDVLFRLADKDSDELKQAESALDDLNYQYQEAVLNASQSDYARENRDINLAREALEEAIADRDAKVMTAEEVQAAKDAVEKAKSQVTTQKIIVANCQQDVDDAQADLNALGGRSEGSGGVGYAAMLAAQAALKDAQEALETAELRFRALYTVLEGLAEDAKAAKESVEGAPVFDLSVYVAALAAEYEDSTAPVNFEGQTYTESELSDAYTEINSAQAAVEACQHTYDDARETYYNSADGGNAAKYDRLAKKLASAQQDLADAQYELTVKQEVQTNEETILTDTETRMTEYKDAVAAAKAAQTALEDKIFELQEQQKDDNKNMALQTLQIDKLKDQIADAEDEVERLRAGSVDAAVVSKVSGVVKSLGVSAGNTAEPGTPLATILVPDRGYAVSITVTADQAKKVTVGDSAEVTTGWWGGGDITARLVSIRPDPSAPNQNRILVFDVGGEVEDGTQLSLSIGQKSQNYDIVVPSSAVRSDANGDFVLIVVAKSSPLGNRYVATRVDVRVLGADDLNTAVSGGVANGDFVITTSTRPLESGMQVRLAEG